MELTRSEAKYHLEKGKIKKVARWRPLMRWEGFEPSRLAAHGPQPCLSANSSTSAGVKVL